MIENFITSAGILPLNAKGAEVVESGLRTNTAAANAVGDTFNDDFWRSFQGGLAVPDMRGKGSHDHLNSLLDSLSSVAIKTSSLKQKSQVSPNRSGRFSGISLPTNPGTSGPKAIGSGQASGASETSAIYLLGEHLQSAKSEAGDRRLSSSTGVEDESSTVVSSADDRNFSLSSFVDRLKLLTVSNLQNGQRGDTHDGDLGGGLESDKADSHQVSKSQEKPLKHTLQDPLSDPLPSFISANRLSDLTTDARVVLRQVSPSPTFAGTSPTDSASFGMDDSTSRSFGDAALIRANTSQAFVFVEDTKNDVSSASLGSGTVLSVSSPSAIVAGTSNSLLGDRPSSDSHNLSGCIARDITAPDGEPADVHRKGGTEANGLQMEGRRDPSELLSNDFNGPEESPANKEVKSTTTLIGRASEAGKSNIALHSAMDANLQLSKKSSSSPNAQEQGTLRVESVSTSQTWRPPQIAFQTDLIDTSISSTAGVLETKDPPTQIGFHQNMKESNRKEPTDSVAGGSLAEVTGTTSSISPAASGSFSNVGSFDRKEISINAASTVNTSVSTEVVNLVPVSASHSPIVNETRTGTVAKGTAHVGLIAPPPENQPTNVDRPEPTVSASTTKLLEVGMSSGSNGWLKVRAESDSGGAVSVSLTSNTGSAVEALHKDLPALTAYLKEQALAVNSLVVHRAEPGALTQDAITTSQQDNFGRSEGKEAQQREREEGIKGGPESTQSEPDYLPTEYLQSSSVEGTVLTRNGWFKAIA